MLLKQIYAFSGLSIVLSCCLVDILVSDDSLLLPKPNGNLLWRQMYAAFS